VPGDRTRMNEKQRHATRQQIALLEGVLGNAASARERMDPQI
jgi:hypothetical protein